MINNNSSGDESSSRRERQYSAHRDSHERSRG